jgi:hypothetical protein
VVATVVAGLLYTSLSPAVALAYVAAWMLAATIASGTLRRSAWYRMQYHSGEDVLPFPA